jgi:MFS transporter, DHA3 family, tetracycline resistance protein
MIIRQTRKKRLSDLLRSLAGAATFRVLGNRSFALLWSGQTLSRIGDYLYQVALAWWVLEHTGSAAAMASLLIVSFTPTLLFLLLGGVAVDRFSRIRIMLTSDVVHGLVASAVATLAICDLLEVWHLYLLNLVFGIVDAFFQPAYTAAIPDLVHDDDLPRANVLTSMGSQIGRIAGPALGAAIVAVGGAPLAFLLNALTFFVAAALLVPLRALPGPRRTASARGRTPLSSLRADLGEGIGVVLSTPWLWITILVSALSNITLAGPYSVALPFLVNTDRQADIGTLGLLYALFPVGYVIGGLWLGRKEQLRRRGLLVYAGLIVAGLTLSVFGLQVPLLVLGMAAIVNGAALEIGSIAWTHMLQQRIPHDKLGRVTSVDALGSFALLPLGYALAGWATELLGAPLVFVVGGWLTAVVAAVVLIGYPAIRGLD